mgnify:CR=1 FL=1
MATRNKVTVDLENGLVKINRKTLTVEEVLDAYNRLKHEQGLDLARTQGKSFGRPKVEVPDNFDYYYQKVKAKEMTVQEATTALGLSRSVFYRFVKQLY